MDSSVTETTGQAIGRRIRELRMIRGWTQQQLATRAGTHRPIVARVENGKHNQSLETIALYARALGVPVLLLIGEDCTGLRAVIEGEIEVGNIRPMPWSRPSARRGRPPRIRKGKQQTSLGKAA